jgi:hypothetical protein
MESRFDRRKFLRNILVLGAGYGLIPSVGCSSSVPTPTAQPTASIPTLSPSSPAAVSSATAGATATAARTATPGPTAAATAAAKVSELAVARGSSPEAITRAAIEALGGMSRFVKKGDRVVIKPNILTAAEPQYAVRRGLE